MTLFTKGLLQNIPALGSTELIPLEERTIVCKFFNPIGAGTWYVIEGGEKGGEFTFYGMIELSKKRFGYFTLNYLKNLNLPFGFKIQRDLDFKPIKVKELFDRH